MDLVLRARVRGSFADVLTRVKRIEDGTQASYAASGLADGDYHLCDEMLSGSAAMTDAPKRLRSHSDEEEVLGYVKVEHSKPGAFAGYTPGMNAVAGASSQTPLPAGISSIDEWGRNRVQFGKFKGKKTYLEVATEETPEMIGYRAYLKSHQHSGPPTVQDLASFVVALEEMHGAKQMPKIPGTNIKRSMWSCQDQPLEFLE